MKNSQLLWHYIAVKMSEEAVFDYFSPEKEVSKRVEVGRWTKYETLQRSHINLRQLLLKSICIECLHYWHCMLSLLCAGEFEDCLSSALYALLKPSRNFDLKDSILLYISSNRFRSFARASL